VHGKKKHSSDCKEAYPNKPHPHAELIKAWADGAEIQFKVCGFGGYEWRSLIAPLWVPNTQYRIKPICIKYRRYLWRDSHGDAVYICNYRTSFAMNVFNPEQLTGFIRWIDTEWQEVEV